MVDCIVCVDLCYFVFEYDVCWYWSVVGLCWVGLVSWYVSGVVDVVL